jgi:hypothetical protein
MLAYGPAPRIEWSPDCTRVLACQRGELGIHTLDGSRTALGDRAILDARWGSDDAIIAVDARGWPEHYDRRGIPSGRFREASNRSIGLYDSAAIAAGGSAYVALSQHHVFVGSTADREQLWWLDPNEHAVHYSQNRIAGALSTDASVLALGFEIRDYSELLRRPDAPTRCQRGLLVLALAATRHGPSRWVRATELDRRYSDIVGDGGPLRFAFDKGRYSRRRLAIAPPAGEAGAGVIRVDKREAYVPGRPGGATAVALDDRGILAAWAYRTGVAERRLQIDYLAPEPKGAPVVEIQDTLWIDPDLDDLVAIAFDSSGRRIACLGADGNVEIVPVP